MANTLALPAASSLIDSFPNLRSRGVTDGLKPGVLSQILISENINSTNLSPPLSFDIKDIKVEK